MNKSSLIRKIASTLLVLCFFLPLSKCTYTTKEGVHNSSTYYAFVWVYELAQDQANHKGNSLENIGFIFMYLVAFIFPIFYIFLKPIPQSIITLLSSLPALYILYVNMLALSPLIGSWLTLISWVALIIISLLTIWQHLPHNKAAHTACCAGWTRFARLWRRRYKSL